MIDASSYRAAMHPVRLPILLACSEGPCATTTLGLSEAEARWHLRILLDAGLVTRDGDVYRARADWRPVRDALEAIAARRTSDG